MVAPRRSAICLNGARAISECTSLPALPAIRRRGPPAAAFCMANSGEPMTTCRLPSSSGGTWDVLPRMVGRTSMPSAAKRPFSIADQSGTLKNVRDTSPMDIFSSIPNLALELAFAICPRHAQ